MAPSGAIAAFDYQSDAGDFGLVQAAGGRVQLEAIDPGNQQATSGSYTLSFSGTDSLSGRFSAAPCAAIPPSTGGCASRVGPKAYRCAIVVADMRAREKAS